MPKFRSVIQRLWMTVASFYNGFIQQKSSNTSPPVHLRIESTDCQERISELLDEIASIEKQSCQLVECLLSSRLTN